MNILPNAYAISPDTMSPEWPKETGVHLMAFIDPANGKDWIYELVEVVKSLRSGNLVVKTDYDWCENFEELANESRFLQLKGGKLEDLANESRHQSERNR